MAAVDPKSVRFICAPSNGFETWADWPPETKRKADVFFYLPVPVSETNLFKQVAHLLQIELGRTAASTRPSS